MNENRMVIASGGERGATVGDRVGPRTRGGTAKSDGFDNHHHDLVESPQSTVMAQNFQSLRYGQSD
jgi:hypothetical protein